MESEKNNQRDAQSRSARDDRPTGERSIAGLIRDLMTEVMALIRDEAALARAEISENVTQLQGGVIAIGLGVILLLVGLIGLMMSAIYGLSHIWPMWLSALVIGGGIVIVALIALLIGKSRLSARSMKLKRTSGELSKDADFAREQL